MEKEDPHSTSQISANPVAGRISASQAGPQRYEPSPIRAAVQGDEQNYYEREDPEVYVEDNHRVTESGQGQNSQKEIDLENMERDVENEDMLAITQHN